MTAPEGETGAGSEPDPVDAGRLRRLAGWLRDLHRGFAYTGHLPRRRE